MWSFTDRPVGPLSSSCPYVHTSGIGFVNNMANMISGFPQRVPKPRTGIWTLHGNRSRTLCRSPYPLPELLYPDDVVSCPAVTVCSQMLAERSSRGTETKESPNSGSAHVAKNLLVRPGRMNQVVSFVFHLCNLLNPP